MRAIDQASGRDDNVSGRVTTNPLAEDGERMIRKGIVLAAMFVMTGLGVSYAGETGAKMEEMKGDMKGAVEEGKGNVKGAVEDMKGNDMKAAGERAKGKAKGGKERAKGKMKGAKERMAE
jgi:hypothetical protein